ncbi:MAG: gamma-glutamylcyclotransferase family protein [Pirellulales bacterium]|jgi:gamma-glutamylcyclotransferase (GGCT)/AIG2-like uncharacterized protein YtfP
MNSEHTPFFVYGTLKRGESREKQWPYAPLKILPAVTTGTLYDLGSYPALIAVGENQIQGELWFIAEEHLAETQFQLDSIEGYPTLYDRIRQTCITLNGEEYQAIMYTYVDQARLTDTMKVLANDTGYCCWNQLSSSS